MFFFFHKFLFFSYFLFSFLITSKQVPILIEVNHSPSFETASPLDDVIKTTVIRDTLRLAGIDSDTLLKTAKNNVILKEKGRWAQKKAQKNKSQSDNPDHKNNVKNVSDSSDSSSGPLPFTSSSKIDRRSSFGTGRTAINGSNDNTRGPTMPSKRKKTNMRRSDNEIIFLERLRTVYVKIQKLKCSVIVLHVY